MNWIMLFVAFTLGAMTMFAMFCLGYTAKIKEPMNMNRVHFYVARDKDGELYLYMGKPVRGDNEFYSCYLDNTNVEFYCYSYDFEFFGINPDDFKDLKWEDEPVEVFLNLEG